jgi:alpha-ketoglutarate-dependent taurine dioxygenase
MTLKVKPHPGDGMVRDGFRVLHGRAAFGPATGERHLSHCYLGRDVVSIR